MASAAAWVVCSAHTSGRPLEPSTLSASWAPFPPPWQSSTPLQHSLSGPKNQDQLKLPRKANFRLRHLMFLLSLSLSYEYSSKRRLHVIYSFVKDYLECERPHIEIYAHISLFSHAPSLSPLPRSAVTMTPQDTWRIECHTNDFGLLR